ncbi:MAG: Glutamyl-tRNA(Gln) amidotransferase subunit A [Rhodospirillaceae bacterium]|nr:MAG: Glutamyl-tRNA(Gln) amidotransferase subunit A [Rhodospirillaceae bacterium]
MDERSDLGAFITPTPDLALEAADQADAKRKGGEDAPLLGIPLGIKDLFCTEGVQTTAASKILQGFVPTYESSVTTNLLRDGALFLGKLNLDEFAMGSSNTTSYYGNVVNPWQSASKPDMQLVPGGSSGGSASAVAARLCLGATGTDTGGSIRQPAAFCGITGLKPTYGRCSRWGIVAFASSLDQAGPMARSVEDCAILLGSMAGFDAKDTTSVDTPVPDYTAELGAGVKGLKIGLPREYRVDGMPAEIEQLWQQSAQWLRDQGAEVVKISLPHTHSALPAYYIVAPAEASSNLARYDGVRYGFRADAPDGLPEFSSLEDMYATTRGEGFGAEVQRRIMIGAYVLSAGYYDAYYNKARRVRSLIARDFTEAFEQVDAILTPTTPSAAFGITEEPSGVEMYMNDVFTVPASMAGIPGISLPAGLSSDGLPLGVQLLGRPFDEVGLLRVAQALEDAAGFTATPQLMA